MKKLLLLAITATLICSVSFANIRRIGYWGTAVPNVDYTTADLAVTAAVTGDTIMVYPNASTWSFSNINKRLVIIGTGYYHYNGANGGTNLNANLQNAQPSSLCNTNFYPGCDGTIVTGCDLTSSSTNGSSGINNIKITNCRLSILYFQNPYTYDNWEISKTEIYSNGLYNYSSTAKVTNLKVFNCILSGTAVYFSSTVNGQTGVFENCTFFNATPTFSNQAFIIQNCIFYSTTPSNYSNTNFYNNVFTTATLPAGISGGNNILVNGAALFVGYPTQGTYSNDERFKLKAGSPAIGVGINGIDCGAFGGVNPYKLSGIPAVPAIYKLTAPSSSASSNPYTITFSVRANN